LSELLRLSVKLLGQGHWCLSISDYEWKRWVLTGDP